MRTLRVNSGTVNSHPRVLCAFGVHRLLGGLALGDQLRADQYLLALADNPFISWRALAACHRSP
jgi:hypothetical protein